MEIIMFTKLLRKLVQKKLYGFGHCSDNGGGNGTGHCS